VRQTAGCASLRSTAVRWAATGQRVGRADALPMGGDRRSGAFEPHASRILGWLERTPDLFLSEIVARLATDGFDRIDAPMLIECAMGGDAFTAWVEQMLVPTLSAGDVVICDNLSVHKNARARAAIEARGAEWRFLPAYCPDLNRGSARSGLK